MNASDLSIIGCRVIIISKAKIRYEGNLHSIDFDTPNEPVITLSKVWSFGTEDRPCERPVAPRNEEYNQVVFRGRDLDDVRVVQSSVFLNEDSAIVSAAPGSALSHPPGLPVNESRSRLDLNPSRVSTGCSELSLILASQSVSLDSLNQNIYPNNSSYQVPAVCCRPAPIGTVHVDNHQISDTRGQRPFGNKRSDIDPGIFNTSGREGASSRDVQESGIGTSRHRAVLGSGVHNDYPQPWANRDQVGKKGDTHKNTPSYYQGHDYPRDRRGGYSQKWSTNHRGSKGSGHTHGGWGGWSADGHDWPKFRSNVSTVNEHTNFSVEYDYERANAELAAELEKITISTRTGSSSTSFDNAENNRSSTTEDENTCYDKFKSFFDTISSEMMDRANGLNPQGMNRRYERLLNSATFGTVPQQYLRRTGYHNQRSFGYGQKRGGNSSSGNFWRSSGTGTNKSPFSNLSDTPLPTSGRAG
ncbi:hypothetical protein MS3_00008219 [Schistosoma haematobium]|uniref:FFD box profile domain-containing protein n=1 Tax=Schistosoma haematobium TaxID=6185 RepID=A0A922LC71_SCHHA|nr:uncharacterized protein MS3_00008219 [Schistosoma haematobium]KAH9577922.1 hypothetical protein MS3_00008219 [Schistosoma haematobium]